MDFKNIDHVGIAVRDIAAALEFWEKTLGLRAQEVETVAEQKTKVAFLPVRDGHENEHDAAKIELLEATDPASPISRFIEKRGEGVHHIALRVDDLDAALAELKAREVRLIDETPRRGAAGMRIAFVHPSAAGGVLLELCERKD